MEVFVQNSPIYCIFRLPSVTDRFNPNIQFPDQICYSDTLVSSNAAMVNSARIGSTLLPILPVKITGSEAPLRVLWDNWAHPRAVSTP